MKKYFHPLIILLISEFFLTCVTQDIETSAPSGLDKKFGLYSYKKENSAMVLIVDVEMARMRKNEKYFPLNVKIANKRLDSLTIDRDNLILVDQNGNAYNMASIDEIQREYDKLFADSRFKNQNLLIGDEIQTSFTFFIRERSNFFPAKPGGARVTNFVIIGKKRYIDDRIYFPMPSSGIEGQILKLRIDTLELHIPFEITFLVE